MLRLLRTFALLLLILLGGTWAFVWATRAPGEGLADAFVNRVAMVFGANAPVSASVAPQRDTPAHLADYVSRFHPRLQGLTGSPEQVAEAARRYRVYFAKVQRPDMTDYLMDHSSFVYLVGPDARVRTLFRPETSPEAMAAAVAAQLGGAGRRG
jgi:hypothetical protein